MGHSSAGTKSLFYGLIICYEEFSLFCFITRLEVRLSPRDQCLSSPLVEVQSTPSYSGIEYPSLADGVGREERNRIWVSSGEKRMNLMPE